MTHALARFAFSAAALMPQCAPDAQRSITLERTSCYGTCPVYSVRIDGEGEVRWHGVNHVVTRGDTTARISRARADSLFRLADSVGFARFDTAYTTGMSGCGTYHTDMPTVTTTIEQSGTAKRVSADYGCGSMPASLRTLHLRIDEIAGTQRWTGAK